jgi:putative membrane protein
VVLFFVIFYAVGITGMLLPITFPLFVKLTPFALLLSSSALAFFHQGYNLKAIAVFFTIFFFGFFIEVYGVNTGVVFGEYSYGNGLGVKLFNTPLIIGLNWLMLVYITSSIFERVKINTILKVILASAIMLGYDVIIEQVAPRLQMWEFSNNTIPAQNYASWFFFALFFHILVKIFGVQTKNQLSVAILVCQVLFFLILFITLKPIN